METVATNEVEAAVSSVDAAEGKGMESVPEKKVSRKSQHKQEGKELCTERICHCSSKVILLRDVPMSAQTRMSNWYAAGNQTRRNGKTRRENE